MISPVPGSSSAISRSVSSSRAAPPRFASSDLLLRAAAQGLGVALARHRLAQQELASGALVRPFETRAIDLGVAYWIVRPRGSTPREAVKILAAWLRREAERAPIDPQSSP